MSTGISDGRGMTVDNIELYRLDDGNRQEVNSTNGTACECKYGYFDDNINTSCILCTTVSPMCEDCEYESLNPTFNISMLTCTACPNGFYSQGSECAGCEETISNCTNCSLDGLLCF